MNLMIDSPAWLIAILIAAIAAAAGEDAFRLRISNVTCAVVLVTAIIAMALHGFPAALWQNALVFVAILAIGTPLFASGQIGGGDVKLLACLGLWLNFSSAVWLVAATLIAGGVLAMAYIAARFFRRREDGRRGRPSNNGIPYGLAIAAGAALVFSSQLWG